MQENYEIFKDLIQIVGLHYYLDILKKSSENAKKKLSELSFSPTLNLKKKSRKATNKKILA